MSGNCCVIYELSANRLAIHTMPYALCPLSSDFCPLRHALCPMLFTGFSAVIIPLCSLR